MIRFIDLRGCDTGYNFAFWDTTKDQFFKFNGRSAWDTSDEFASDYRCECGSISLSRFLNLMPDWTKLEL